MESRPVHHMFPGSGGDSGFGPVYDLRAVALRSAHRTRLIIEVQTEQQTAGRAVNLWQPPDEKRAARQGSPKSREEPPQRGDSATHRDHAVMQQTCAGLHCSFGYGCRTGSPQASLFRAVQDRLKVSLCGSAAYIRVVSACSTA